MLLFFVSCSAIERTLSFACVGILLQRIRVTNEDFMASVDLRHVLRFTCFTCSACSSSSVSWQSQQLSLPLKLYATKWLHPQPQSGDRYQSQVAPPSRAPIVLPFCRLHKEKCKYLMCAFVHGMWLAFLAWRISAFKYLMKTEDSSLGQRVPSAAIPISNGSNSNFSTCTHTHYRWLGLSRNSVNCSRKVPGTVQWNYYLIISDKVQLVVLVRC